MSPISITQVCNEKLIFNPPPFGMQIENRSYTSSDTGYKYGFNGMERDDEVKGSGNSLDFGARIYDSRLGKWMSIDRYWKKYPNQSNYSYAINSPNMYKDIDGNDIWLTINKAEQNEKGEIELNVKTVLRIKTDVSLVVNMNSNLPQTAIDALFAAEFEPFIIEARESINSLINGDVFDQTLDLMQSTFGMDEIDAVGLNFAAHTVVICGIKVDFDITCMYNELGALETGFFWGWGTGLGLDAGAGVEVVAYDINENNSTFSNRGLETFEGPQFTTGFGLGAISGTRIFSDGYSEPATKLFGLNFDEELYTAYGLGGVTPLPPLEKVRVGASRMAEQSYFLGSTTLTDCINMDKDCTNLDNPAEK